MPAPAAACHLDAPWPERFTGENGSLAPGRLACQQLGREQHARAPAEVKKGKRDLREGERRVALRPGCRFRVGAGEARRAD